MILSKKKRIKFLVYFLCSIYFSFHLENLLFSSSLQDWISKKKPVKNVILIIGDGLGIPATTLLKDYFKYYKKDEKNHFIEFVKKSNISLTSTNAADHIITDSAGSATAIVTGVQTNNKYVGLSKNGEELPTLIDFFNNKKKSTGFITNTSITHATPAAFYAKVNDRKLEEKIAEHAFMRSDIKVMLGGGLEYFIPQDVNIFKFKEKYKLDNDFYMKSARNDSKNIIDYWAEKENTKLVFSREDLMNIDLQKDQVIRGIFSNEYLPYEIDRKENPIYKNKPSLTEMYKKSVSILEKNSNGFFLAIEAGLIDVAEHSIDIVSVLYEMIELNNLLGSIMEYVEKNPDTMVILTGDHSTGDFGILYTFKHVNNELIKFYHTQQTFFNIFEKQKISYLDLFQSVITEKKENGLHLNIPKLTELINKNFPVGNLSEADIRKIFVIEKDNFFNYKKAMESFPSLKDYYSSTYYLHAVFNYYIAPKIGINWLSGTHTSTMINTYSYGMKKIQQSYINNYDIFHQICDNFKD